MALKYSISQATTRLNELGYDAGGVSNIIGPMFKQATIEFQKAQGLATTGYGPITEGVLFSGAAKKVVFDREEKTTPPPLPPASPISITKNGVRAWPTQAGCNAFFGQPGNPRATAGKGHFPFPFRIAWDLDEKVSQFACHELCADAFTSIFANAAQHYGQDEMQKLGLDLFGGCYNLRKMRGGSSWSMHSWGIALDLDPTRNDLKMNHNQAVFAKPAYVPFWNIVEAHGALSLGRSRDYDWMHFQFARLS